MRKRGIWIILIVVLLLAAGGGYVAYTRYSAQAQTPQEPALQTETVSRGDIVITADGTGNLLPATELALAFRANGVLAEVKVEVGDRVQAGDVLARLDTLQLENTVREATYELEQARFDLQTVQREVESGTDVEIAWKSVEAARLGLANAQGNYASTLLRSDVSADVREAKAMADFWASELGDKWLRLDESPNSEKRLLEYERASAQAERATNQWKQIEQDAQNQKTAAWRSVVSAQQAYLSALSSYTDTISGDPVREAELNVFQKEIKLTEAQIDLENATLIAPVDGTVIEVTAVAGENAGSASIITLADLERPLVRFWVEEADMGSVVIGNRVSIVFEALPDETFSGEIIRVDPALVTVGNTPAVQAWASVDRPSKPTTFLSGMTAEVEVIAAETRDALLVPLQALREISDGQYAVFVVGADGELEMRAVEVGLKDFVNAEILSGLEPGEVVSLGTETTSNQSTQLPTEGGPPPGGGMMPFFEGR